MAREAANFVLLERGFVESLLTELVVALVIRTRRPFYRSRPGTLVLVSTVVLIPLTLAIPFLPGASMLGFVPLPGLITATIVALAVSYAVSELQKAWFYHSR